MAKTFIASKSWLRRLAETVEHKVLKVREIHVTISCHWKLKRHIISPTLGLFINCKRPPKKE